MDKLAHQPTHGTTKLDSAQTAEQAARDHLTLVPNLNDHAQEQVISQIEVARIRYVVGALPKLHQLVITWHFGLDGLTLSRREIADRLRLRPAAVRRIEAEALRHLRCLLLTQGEAA